MSTNSTSNSNSQSNSTISETISVVADGERIRVERTNGETRVWTDGKERNPESPEGKQAIERAEQARDDARDTARTRATSIVGRVRSRLAGLF